MSTTACTASSCPTIFRRSPSSKSRDSILRSSGFSCLPVETFIRVFLWNLYSLRQLVEMLGTLELCGDRLDPSQVSFLRISVGGLQRQARTRPSVGFRLVFQTGE